MNSVRRRITIRHDDPAVSLERQITVEQQRRVTVARVLRKPSTSGTLGGRGWVSLRDDVNDEASPLVLADGVRTQLTLNPGVSSELGYAPAGSDAAWWSSNAFQTEAIGDTYDARLTFEAKPALIGRSIEWEFDIAGLGVVGGGHLSLTQDAGVARRLQVVIPYFTLATFQSGGARIFLTADGNVDLWGQALFIRRIPGDAQ